MDFFFIVLPSPSSNVSTCPGYVSFAQSGGHAKVFLATDDQANGVENGHYHAERVVIAHVAHLHVTTDGHHQDVEQQVDQTRPQMFQDDGHCADDHKNDVDDNVQPVNILEMAVDQIHDHGDGCEQQERTKDDAEDEAKPRRYIASACHSGCSSWWTRRK